MVKVPPYLKPGDTIALVCPSGYMSLEKAQTCIDVLKEWGYKVKVGTTVGSHSTNYFSGTDEERLINFQQILDDDSVNAVLCARGGYGLSRIIDHISFRKFKKHPKWIIGFSDITVLLSHIYTNFEIATMHAPMAGAFNNDGYRNGYVQSLKNVMEGKNIKYEVPGHEFNRKGEGIGELVGGNLAMLAHMVGTPSDIKTKGRILFLEDVGEYLYNIDRMMHQLKRSGKLDKLAGLIIGGFSDTKDTERPFGQNVYEIIRDIVKEYDYPVCFGFPVSHEKENYALKVGVGYKLKVGKSKTVLIG
ncbi:LD-carboxypeptidase [Niastella koreensis]|uniref:Peptidase U61 LD-carboxypeptidase A n=2 Tax=Niastella koreensis TaxID=354356 RepID=G8TE07_NIAKG|nr:LD-carboxypeptidase [Niastella koreensis]AEW03555.1 peptidase U61 LD-carboxypeptidase A [Niastella koreensis GR20-10]OQP53914.1 LD-carboxypeptidase [Niastella koreensis]